MTELAPLTTADKRQTLQDFCAAQTLEPEEITSHCLQAWRSTTSEGHMYLVLAKRYDNVGGQAIKIIIYREEEKRRRFIGSVGLHHPDANPYVKVPDGEHTERSLYEIIAPSDQ